MSASSISSGNLFSYNNESIQSNSQSFQGEFQQLGQDLQAGNLSAAQQDFVTLQQLAPEGSSASSARSNNPIAQAFNQLSQDLQSGNLSGAQQDYANIQQDFQNLASKGHRHHRHHHSSDGSGEIGQLLDQLGQALQSGNLSGAQQFYATLQQDLQKFGQSFEQTSQSSSPQSSANSLSVTA